MTADAVELGAWFARRVPADWFEGIEVRIDREEILVVGELPTPATPEDPKRCIEQFRDLTREHRMAIAEEGEATFGRKVSWGAACGALELHFTTASVPVMTRLRMDERAVLDTLIDAGVARSRSEALAWCVRLVASHEEDWINDLRKAVEHVRQARAAGPDPT
jgi:hypothetical protein